MNQQLRSKDESTSTENRSTESAPSTTEPGGGNGAIGSRNPAGNRQPRSRWWVRLLPIVARSAISIFIIVIGVAIFLGMSHGRSPRKKKPRPAPRAVVEAVPLELHDGGIDFDVDGVVIAYRALDVPAEVAGRVVFRSDNCRIGRTVEQDELLLRIDRQDYDLEVARLEEQLKQAEASIHELEVDIRARERQIKLAEEDLAIKKREVERFERIDDPGVYSKSELDAARLKELQARDAVQTENDQRELLEAQRDRLASASRLVARQLEKARLDVARSEIRAPSRGVIANEPTEEGCFVQRGGVVAVIQDTSCMEIKCSLQMRQMHWLWQARGQQTAKRETSPTYDFPKTQVSVIYHVDDVQYRWNGELGDYAGAQVDQQTRLVPCRVYVRNPNEVQVVRSRPHGPSTASPPGLMAGMFVTVRVHAQPDICLFRLPETAIQPGNRVWVVRDVTEGTPASGKLHEVGVRVAHSRGDWVVAYGTTDSLRAGDLIASSPVACPSEAADVDVLVQRDSTRGELSQSPPDVFERVNSPSRKAGGSDARASGEGQYPLSGPDGPTLPKGRVNLETRFQPQRGWEDAT